MSLALTITITNLLRLFGNLSCSTSIIQKGSGLTTNYSYRHTRTHAEQVNNEYIHERKKEKQRRLEPINSLRLIYTNYNIINFLGPVGASNNDEYNFILPIKNIS